MLKQNKAAPPEAVAMLGELHPLMQQLGAADGLFTLSATAASLRLPRLDTFEAFASFLEAYRVHVLLPLELPAIYRAHWHASHNEVRELIALDLELDAQPKEFAMASQRVGRCQLERLRPLRDERVVQRYLQAVREERAHGWHTLVFGLTLALYSLPVRQGLLTYARQTLRGFIQVAARPLHLSKTDCRELLETMCADLPKALATVLDANLGAESTAKKSGASAGPP